ncbi:hypothetical protein PRIPAC_71196 [Pristionchus pacificus]|uniref:Uncharacterized protein n=1 Tax=Pristionchus pacificus TaxID=54126 RepID=A0A2A6C1H9_PRIPA|nr:hypothetical protein PRIPAC_71196 [Pristionchus pacificus]|eukprot:PDM71968.1 hypothetical protein PRIPAC_38375 [Pristionchus pacificus]
MVRESDRVKEWQPTSIEDDGDYEISGGPMRKMVQAVEQRERRERKEVLTKSGRRMISEIKIANPIDNLKNNEEEELEEDIEVLSLQGNINEDDIDQDENTIIICFVEQPERDNDPRKIYKETALTLVTILSSLRSNLSILSLIALINAIPLMHIIIQESKRIIILLLHLIRQWMMIIHLHLFFFSRKWIILLNLNLISPLFEWIARHKRIGWQSQSNGLQRERE